MTYKESKEKLCEKYKCTIIEDENTIQICFDDNDAHIIFYKNNWDYKVHGFGSPWSFTTSPIYEDWKEMIIAWWLEEEVDNEENL